MKTIIETLKTKQLLEKHIKESNEQLDDLNLALKNELEEISIMLYSKIGYVTAIEFIKEVLNIKIVEAKNIFNEFKRKSEKNAVRMKKTITLRNSEGFFIAIDKEKANHFAEIYDKYIGNRSNKIAAIKHLRFGIDKSQGL